MMDDRARVPFALLGVLLLVSSATLVTTIDPARPATDSETEVVVERTTATTQTVLREAVSTASREAAADPVVTPANTTVGRALNDSTAFRDALRLRIYLAARDRLQDVRVGQGSVTGTVTLPQPSNQQQIERAIERVDLERADQNGTAIQVTIENITLRTRRNGGVVTEKALTPTVTVVTPVLAAHDRVSAFQDRLDAGVTERGLSQRLTAQLYALAWSRGYIQYGGVPISNVVSNQHVGVITNNALLDLQRTTIGHSDPRGRRTLTVAAARTTARDLTVATGRDNRITDALLKGPTNPSDSEIQGIEPPQRSGPEEERRIEINETADRAFLDLLDSGTLNASIASAYTIDVRLLGHVDGDLQVDATPPSSPGGDWTRIDQQRDRTSWKQNVSVQPPAVPEGWHAFETYSRQTVVKVQIDRTWQRVVEDDNGTESTEQRTTSRSTFARRNVSVAVVGRHDGSQFAPNRTIRTAHQRGVGPLNGPNLADARSNVREWAIERQGGRATLLERAAHNDLPEIRNPTLERPDNVTEWVYRDLMVLRERVRDEHVTIKQGAIGAFQVNPPARLADRLAERRRALLDTPDTYDSAAAKARFVARAAYLDRVEARLRSRAADRRNQGSAVSDSLEGAGTSMAHLQRSLEAQERPAPERQPRVAGIGGDVRLTADSAPAYLTQSELTHDEIPAIDGREHPMVAENINVFAVPHQTVSDTIVDGVFGTNSRVSLQVAARTLHATNTTLADVNRTALFEPDPDANRSDESEIQRRKRASNVSDLTKKRNTLVQKINESTRHVLDGQQAILGAHGIGDRSGDRAAMVQRAHAPWNTTHTRALAVANGSVTRRLLSIATHRANLTVTERDRLTLRLNESLAQSLNESAGRPATDTVNASRSMTHQVTRELAREVAKTGAEQATTEAYERTMERSFGAMPSGLPLAPVPGYWYATMNVWHVTVRGEYARFGVRASQGQPTTPGSEFVYARDGESVTLDVDGDGQAERLGQSTRVDFEASATVLVIVPPGSTGVGDTNGVMFERSDGWPGPG